MNLRNLKEEVRESVVNANRLKAYLDEQSIQMKHINSVIDKLLFVMDELDRISKKLNGIRG